MRNTLIYILLVLCVVSCKQWTKATDFITKPSAREIYARNFKTDSVFFPEWEREYKKAMFDSLEITLPYLEKGLFRPSNKVAHSYNVELREGENFTITVRTDSLKEQVFLNAFLWNALAPKTSEPIAENNPFEKSLSFFVEETGTYKIVAQPEMALYSHFELVAERGPSYHFPVVGKGNSAIQSFWGAPRGGGTRTHQGIDIFAERGTAVIAIVDGRTSFVGERGLGGKQVWLREGLLGNSLYYAHLDSTAVKSGQKVAMGDTLGFVGNTGNARTTAPHLHFGIYRRFGGAVNPLPFVKKKAPIKIFAMDRTALEYGVVKVPKGNLRNSTTSNSNKIGEVNKQDTLVVLGKVDEWMHVIAPNDQKAFLHESLLGQ